MNFRVEEGPVFKLTNDQETALAMMLQMHDIFILSGFAGCGKTVVANELVNVLRDSGKHVVVTAPTHKALSVIEGDCTIHSYLGLKLTWENDKQVLVRSGMFDSRVSYNDVLIIDEISMLGSELVSFVLEEQKNSNLKILMIGDRQQIQPINEKISPVWKLKTPNFALTEIVRQARDSGIISLATAVRTGILRPGGDFSRYVNNTDIFSGNIHQMKKFFCENLEKGEESMPVIISHKNKIVNSANSWARNIVKGRPTEPFLVGEKVYIRSTNDHQKHNLEDIVEITKISNKFKYLKVEVPHVFYVFRIKVKSHKGEDVLYIPASEKDSEIIQINKKELASLARSFKIPWRDFWTFSESISEVKHIYSMTAHRSQGSTYKNVVINFNDIQNKNILYTAITRASEKVFLLKE